MSVTTREAGDQAVRARFELDETGWWVASIPRFKGCHTQGRTIAEARRRLREALGLYVSDPARYRFLESRVIPKRVSALVARASRSARKVQDALARQRSAAREATDVLTRQFGLSRRSIAELLGYSHQRIQQLLDRAA